MLTSRAEIRCVAQARAIEKSEDGTRRTRNGLSAPARRRATGCVWGSATRRPSMTL